MRVDSDIPVVKYVPDWFPGAGFKREAKRMRSDLYKATERPYQHVKNEIVGSPSQWPLMTKN